MYKLIPKENIKTKNSEDWLTYGKNLYREKEDDSRESSKSNKPFQYFFNW